jgi:hypothetical protein
MSVANRLQKLVAQPGYPARYFDQPDRWIHDPRCDSPPPIRRPPALRHGPKGGCAIRHAAPSLPAKHFGWASCAFGRREESTGVHLSPHPRGRHADTDRLRSQHTQGSPSVVDDGFGGDGWSCNSESLGRPSTRFTGVHAPKGVPAMTLASNNWG